MIDTIREGFKRLLMAGERGCGRAEATGSDMVRGGYR